MKSHSKHLPRRALSFMVMCAMVLSLLPAVTFAAGERAAGQRTYYVSVSGKGGNNGLSQSAPLPGLDAVPWDQLLPGDSVLLKKGDTFPGAIRLVDVHGTADDPITIGAYGTGNAPVIESRGQGIWLPETGNGNGSDPGKYVSSGVTLYDCSYITVSGLTIVNVPDAMKTSFVNADNSSRENEDKGKMTYSGIGVAADGVGAAEGITLTDITVRGNSDLVAVKTDTSTTINTTGVTTGAAASPHAFTNAAGTYYVSSLSGSDSNDGTSPDTAFYSLHKINELNLQPGAKVYLERGSVFENQYLHVEGGGEEGNPVIIDAYGKSSDPKPLINTNGEGVWYQNFRKNLDNSRHLIHGFVSSSILLYDVPYVEVKNIAMTNGGTYGQTVNSFRYIGENQVDGGTVPGETGYNSTNSNAVGCYQWGGKMCRTGVGGVAQNKGTVTHTLLQNLDIENVYGNVFVKHMDNGGIYFTAAKPLNEAATGIAKYDDLVIEGCYLKRVSRWGIAAVHTAYWAELSTNSENQVTDERGKQYGSSGVVIRNNYLEEVGGDVITLMHAFEPVAEYNVGYRGGREISASTYHSGTAIMNNKQSFAAGIWPWKCKLAVFEHNECYDMLNNEDGNGDGQAWDADWSDTTVYLYNYSSGNSGGCIMICNDHAYNTVFRYNISFDDGSFGLPAGAIDVPTAPNGQISNNTFLLKDGLRCYYRAGYNHKPVQVWNNIFYNLGSNGSFDAKWNDAKLTFNNNVYCGFGTAPSDDSNKIVMTKSEKLFADPAFAGAPRGPKTTDKTGIGSVNGVRSWSHNWASDFAMFRLADDVSDKIINKTIDIGYTGLTQDNSFGAARLVNETDFFGNALDDIHDIGAQDTRTKGGGSVCELVSSLYELSNTQFKVPFTASNPMTVADFAKGLTVPEGASVKVYDGTTEKTADDAIAENMTVKIVAGDGKTESQTTYTIKNKNTYNSYEEWGDGSQGNVWFYQHDNGTEIVDHTHKESWGWGGEESAGYKSAQQSQACGSITEEQGSGFTFRAPADGNVQIALWNYKNDTANPTHDQAQKRADTSSNGNTLTPYIGFFVNGEKLAGKDISLPKNGSATAVTPITLALEQGDCVSVFACNEGPFTNSSGNNGVYFNPVITYLDTAFTKPADTKEPTTPGNLRAANVTATSAELSWKASTDNVGVTGYKVTVGDGEAETVTGLTKTLADLTPDTQYTVTVKAVDGADNESSAATVTFRTPKAPDTEAPAAPTGGESKSTTSDTATISWTASVSNDVDHYEVTVGSGEPEIVRNITQVTLTGLTPETGYTANVVAVDAAGNTSDPALPITFTTAAAAAPAALAAPETVLVAKLGYTSAEIRWRASDGAEGYKVKLDGGAAQDVGDVNRYTFRGLTANRECTASVCAYRGTETTDWVSVTFQTAPVVYNSFEDWNNGAQGEIWRYQYQDATGTIVDHTISASWGWDGSAESNYRSVEKNQACGSVAAGQGSGYTFVAPSTGTVQVRFFCYPDKNSSEHTEDAVKRRANTNDGIEPYIRLYVNGKELTKKVISLEKHADEQTVQPVTVSVQAGQKLSILAWNGGDYESWSGGMCSILYSPVITYLNDDYVPEAESAEISQTTATIYTNTTETADRKHTVQLAVTNIQPEGADPKITWSIRSGDAGVVSVDETGLVTALGNSSTPAVVTATISSDYGDITKTCAVTVRTRMESITVKKGGAAIDPADENAVTVYANAGDTGRSVTLTAEPTPANPTHPNLNWNIVEGAGYQGVISLVKNGTNGSSATITAGTSETGVGLAKVRVESADHPDTGTEFTVRVVRKLANNVSITPAAPKFGQTLTVNTNQLQMTQAGMNGLSYQWYKTAEGETEPTEITGATGRTYKLQDEDDIGAVFSVKVTADPNTFYEGEKTASTNAVAKAEGGSVASARVVNCTTEDDNDGKITNLNSGYAHQYREKTDPEGEWIDVPEGTTEITPLTPGTYQVRRAETDTHTAGPVSELKVLSFEESADTHAINIGSFDNGAVTPSAWHAKEGTEITLTVEPEEGYRLVKDSLEVTYTYTDENGDEQTKTVDVTDGVFEMPAYDVTVTAGFEKQRFTLDHRLENINCDQGANNHEVEYGDELTIHLTADTAKGYTMPSTVTVKTEDGEEFEGYQYNRSEDDPDTATIVFDQGITQNLIITGAAVLKSYTVNYNIRNLSAPEEDAPRTVEHNADYTGKLEADEGYALPENILMTMGSASFADFTYDPETGVIDIAANKITGNLVITGEGVDASVDPVSVTGVELSRTSASMKIDDTITLTATVLPDDATVTMVSWSSSDPEVVFVDENGEVTALAEGTATITVTTVDGGVTATCTVTVTKASTTTSGGSVGSSTVSKTDTDEDGTVTTTETNMATGKVTETVVAPDGSKVEKVTAMDNSVTITVTDPEGEELAKVEIPATIPVPETKFEDIDQTPWAEKAINNMAGLKLVEGIGGNKYDPYALMTRGSLATVLHRLSQGKTDYATTFRDVDSTKYYAEGVAWAAKAKVVTGYTADIFAPDDIITREQLAVMMVRYARLIGMDTAAKAESLSAFVDGENTGTWAVDGVAWCVEKGILRGKGNDVLDPAAEVTRAEVAVMLDRFVSLLGK